MIQLLIGRWSRRGQGRGSLEPGRLEIFKQAFPAAFAAIAAFAVTAKSAGRIEEVGAVDPDHPSLELRSHVQSHVDTLAPDTSGQTIHRVVTELDGLAGRSESHGGQHRTENLLLGDHRRGMYVAEQRGWIVEPARGQLDLRLPAGC